MGPKEPAPAGVQMKISGYDVHFPFKPYASQLVRATPRDHARRDDDRPPRDATPPPVPAPPPPGPEILAPSVSPRPTPSTAQGVMGKVLKAADSGENALLESPTGSGKSLALLCSGTPPLPAFLGTPSFANPPNVPIPDFAVALTPTPTFSVRARFASALAWQERWKATHGVGGAGVKVDAEGWIEDADPSSAPSSSGEKENVVSPDAPAAAATRTPPKVPRIYYATRTHSQIAQVVKELKRTAYRPSMVVLGSREHYCINKSVRARRGGNLGEECKALLEGGARRSQTREDADERGGGGGGGCGYSHGAMKLAGAARRPGSDPVDIEDLVALGGKTRGCPYFAAKHMSETAELIFCPYNYLLDPSVRAAMDVDVKGALVILDEAHNVEDVAREAASCDVALSDVVAAAEEFRRVASFDDENRENHPNVRTRMLRTRILIRTRMLRTRSGTLSSRASWRAWRVGSAVPRTCRTRDVRSARTVSSGGWRCGRTARAWRGKCGTWDSIPRG